MENVLKGNENCFELAGGSSYRGFELPGVDCITLVIWVRVKVIGDAHITWVWGMGIPMSL